MCDTILESWKVHFGFNHYFASPFCSVPSDLVTLLRDKQPTCLRHLRASYLSLGRITSPGAQGPSTYQVIRQSLVLVDKALGRGHPLPALPPFPQGGGRDKEETRHFKSTC